MTTTPTTPVLPANPVMANALVAAGVAAKPTQMQLIWQAVKEAMPNGITSAKLAKRLSALPQGNVASLLSQMEKRGMVYTRDTKGNGPKGTAKEYLTDMPAYQQLPLPQVFKAKEAARKRKYRRDEAPALAPRPAPTPTPYIVGDVRVVTLDAVLTMVDELTLSEARQLYATLDKLFGKGK